MTREYGFEIDLDNYTQEGNVRVFDVKADKEKVDAFITDNSLFKDAHSGCICDCEKNYGKGCLNPKAYLSGGCK